MNNRQESLLSFLISNQEYKSIKLIANHFAVSEKTIRRDLDVFRSFLSGTNASIDIKHGKGIRLSAAPDVLESLQQGLHSQKQVNQDRKERNLLQALFILFSRLDQVPLKALGFFFFVSHSQLLLDLKAIEEVFAHYKVDLKISKEGVKVSAKVNDLRSLLIHLLNQYYDYGYERESIVYPVGVDKAIFIVKQLVTQQDTDFLKRIMRQIEEASEKRLWKLDYAIITNSLFVLIKSKTINEATAATLEPYERNGCLEFTLPEITRNEIEREYGILLDDEDLQVIRNIFLSTGFVSDPSFDQLKLSSAEKSQLIHNFSEDFIDAFSTITDINLRENTTFCLRIHEHIEPMVNRVLLNLSVTDRLLDTYAKEYRGTMNVCEVICWILSQKYGLPEIPNAEVLFLMLYIQTEIIEAESRLRVGLLSNEEKSIVNLELARISKEFPNWEINLFQSLDKEKFFAENLDFVVATIGSGINESIPHVDVSPKLSELDLRHIKTVVFNHTGDSMKEFIKLQNIFRDLVDLGCTIVFTAKPLQDKGKKLQSLRMEGVGKTVFNYLHKDEIENKLYIQYPLDPNGQFEFHFRMNNWDFLLFASKIVFLVDLTSQEKLYGTIQKIENNLKEINV